MWCYRNENVNQITREYSKIIQKVYKRRHYIVGVVSYWGLGEKLKFGHVEKLYLLKPETARENETRKIFRDFKIKTITHSKLEYHS